MEIGIFRSVLLPIQPLWLALTFSGHWGRLSRPYSISSAYFTMSNYHYSSSFRSTLAPDLQLFPSLSIYSLARTVLSTGSQLTTPIYREAKPLWWSIWKIFWVHLKYSGSQVLNSHCQSKSKPIFSSCSFMLLMLVLVHSAGSMPLYLAAFSAGSPKLSHPIGFTTSKSLDL